MMVRITNPSEPPAAHRGRPAPTSGPLGIRRGGVAANNPCTACGRIGRADNPRGNPCMTCGVGVPPNPPGNASSRERRAWAESQLHRMPNPGFEMPGSPLSAAQMISGRRQRRMTKMAMGLSGQLATPERVANYGDVGPLALSLAATTSPETYPNLYRQQNPAPANPWATYWGGPGPGYGWSNFYWRPRSAPAVPFGAFATGVNWPWNGTAPYPRRQRWYYYNNNPPQAATVPMLPAMAPTHGNPGWMLAIGSGLVGAAAGALANCFARTIIEPFTVHEPGQDTTLRVRFGPCLTKERFEALVTRDFKDGTQPQVFGPSYFDTYEQAINWADEQAGFAWRGKIAPATVSAATTQSTVQAHLAGMNPYTKGVNQWVGNMANQAPAFHGYPWPSGMRPARVLARANIQRAANPGNPPVWPPPSAHSQFAPLPLQWWKWQSPSTAGAPFAGQIPFAAPGPPPGVFGQGNVCYSDVDCRKNEYCHGGVCVRSPWGGAATPNPTPMQSLTIPLVPGFAAAA